jgi:hypothetical protein
MKPDRTPEVVYVIGDQSVVSMRHKLIALLEMAAEAERLNRYPQAEHLYKRALVLTRACFGACSPQRAAVLWDLARVTELQQRRLEADRFSSRAYAIGFQTAFSKHLPAA